MDRAWDVEFTDEFAAWWDGLTAAEQKSVDFTVNLLQELGPTLRMPPSSGVENSQHTHMRELRIQHEGRPVSRKQILEQVWGVHEDTDTRAIDNFIVRLRRYIETDPAQPRHLTTVRGVGYRFTAEPE